MRRPCRLRDHELTTDEIFTTTIQILSPSVTANPEECGCGAGPGGIPTPNNDPFDPEKWIESIAGKTVFPTQFKDIPLKLQNALKNGDPISLHGNNFNNTSGIYWLPRPDGSIDESTGPARFISGDARMEWRLRLLNIIRDYDGYVFIEETGMKSLLQDLLDIMTTGGIGVEFSSSSSSAIATYSPTLNKILIHDVSSVDNVSDETIIHESVHALDHHHGWYVSAWNAAYARNWEGLGYTAQHFWTLLQHLKSYEDAVRAFDSNTANNETVKELVTLWRSFLVQARNFKIIYTVTWTSYGTQKTEKIKDADINDVGSKLGIELRISTKLIPMYESILAQRGLCIRLRPDYVDGGSLQKLPPVFDK